MRFLNVKTLKLHSFDDASAYPPYAILSHCWYSSEHELTFKDFEDLSQHSSKPGYSKVVSACHAAVTQGYEWLWADSVCINEEDAVEKEETMKKIYSMFLKAGICLLYLSEIPNANIKGDDKEVLSSEVRKSRWVSRAWTYKELIPPHKSIFYAADWSQLDPEFQAEINTKMFGVSQADGSKEDRTHRHPPRVRSSQREIKPVSRPRAATEEQIQAAENPTPTPSPPPAVVEPQHRSNASQSKQPSTTTDGSTPRTSGPTVSGSLISFTSSSSTQPASKEEQESLINSQLNIFLNSITPSESALVSSFVHRKGSSGDSGDDDVMRDFNYLPAKSQHGIRILILDNDHAVGHALSSLLRDLIPAVVTVDSGYVVNLKGSGHDIVFARGKGTPLLYMPPNYSHQGAVQMLKKSLTVPLLPSSVPTVTFEEYGEYQVICESQKQMCLAGLASAVLRDEKAYGNDFTLKFGVAFSDGSVCSPQVSFSDLASHNSPLEPVAQGEPLDHPTMDLATSDLFGDQQAMDHLAVGHHVLLRPMKDAGPADSYPHNPSSINTQSPNEYGSVQSEAIANSPCSSTFDLTVQSKGTHPSTVPTSLAHKPQNLKRLLSSLQATLGQAEEEKNESSTQHEEQNQWSPRKSEKSRAEFDRATTYSFDTVSDDPKLQYFQAFIDQLAEDVRADIQGATMKDVGPGFLEDILREFAWKLHGEATNPFQLETSVIIHRKRRYIVDLLDFQVPSFETVESESVHSFMGSEEADYENGTPTEPFRKAEETIVDWIGGVSSGATSHLSQMPKYRQFIQGSNAYRWLLAKISQHRQLACEKPSSMDKIGASIREDLRSHISQRKISRSQAPVWFEIIYILGWDPMRLMRRAGISSDFAKALPNIICLTGSWNEAQATTVAEYMEQTWPQSGRAIITLLQEILSVWEKSNAGHSEISVDCKHSFDLIALKGVIKPDSDGNICCQVSAKGGYYIVSEIGEQISWLASALRSVTGTGSDFVSTTPSIETLFTSVVRSRSSERIKGITGTCCIKFSQRIEAPDDLDPGSCWKRLFSRPNFVRGYPIQRRSMPRTGLEMPLRYAASIVGSYEVVQWDGRLLIKGFNMLMIATHVATDVMVWHLYVTDKPGVRISYVDPRLDEIELKYTEEISLRYIERKRHIIGWCTKATDLCGNPTANHGIKPAGLPRAPASTVIDKLYIEGGSPVTAGLMLDINKKEQPFWLQREKDYPSLLNWVKLQPVVFYDVEDRRAWLVDGASAVLHLVRVSLHRDTNDPESAYDWVYDPSKLKDYWPGVGSRQAALQTLKRWENRALSVYVVGNHVDPNGALIPKYSTFEERVENILHSIERLVDRQAKTASQDGIRISQTLDPRREIVGFDIVDIIDPSVPIYPRIQHLNAWGHGWNDLIPTIGITTIFGRNFGDLIRSDKPDEICPNWRSIPTGRDYLAASVSTMQMLHEKRLLRMEPGLVGGELTKKITWVASKEASVQCNCLKRHSMRGAQVARSECNHNPVQFLARKWWSRTIPHGLKPVHLGSLDPGGAVIFGHTVLGLRAGDRSTSRQADDDGAASTTSGEQTQDASATGSIVSQTTSITVPSVVNSSQDVRSAQQSLDSTSNATGEGKRKRWSKFKDWVKR